MESDYLNKFFEKTKIKNEAANFETAIAASSFGKFNYFLYLLAIPAGWATVFEVTTMSYIFPAAQCDLNLNLDDKGLLNAITFAGMVSTGFIWGFLSDSFGRKKLLVICFLLDAFFVILSSLSQNVTILILSKFCGGMIINGPTAALTSYISEFHGTHHRSKMQMFRGTIVSCGSMILPLLAWAIVPLNIKLNFFNLYEYHSWNLYLLICALPSLFSGVTFIFMPESPKFLMSIGQNKKALKVFKQVYHLNTGLPSDTYPIKELVKENKARDSKMIMESNFQKLKEEFLQMKTLFLSPNLFNIILVCSIQFFNKSSMSPLKLWLPQIFQAINDYHHHHNGSNAPLCTMLKELQPSNITHNCKVNLENSFVYINTMVAALVAIIGYILAGTIINLLGEKKLLISLGTISSISAVLIYFAQNTVATLVLTSSTTALGSICSNALLTIVIELFPTKLRTTAISLVMMMNKGGSMVGNLFFPFLLQLGCGPPFFSISLAILGSTLISLFLPKTDYQPLQ